jgi:hypothetical protein
VEAEYPELPVGGRELVLGQEVRGELTTADHHSTGGYRVQAGEIQGRRGTSATIDLTSYEFDALIAVVGPGLGSVRRGGSTGGGCRSRVRVRFREDAPYRVIVTTGSGDRAPTGRFFLRASARSPSKVPLRCRFLLSLLEAAPRGTLELGREVQGQLTTPDYSGSQGIHAWELAGRRGQERTVDLRSEDADFALILVGANVVLVDEDGAGGCDDRVTITFPEDGTYRVVATNESRDRGTGRYTLLVSERAGPIGDGMCWRRGQGLLDVPLAELPTYDRRLALGHEYSGELTTSDHRRAEGTGGSYVQAWGIDGRRGTSVTIDLIRQDTGYDPKLTVLGPGIDAPLEDFHGGGACNARLTVRFPEDGLYRVIVGSTGPKPIGKFVLRVTAQPGPIAPGAC